MVPEIDSASRRSRPCGLVRATVITANPADPQIQSEADEILRDIQRKYRIVKKPVRS